MQLRSATGGAAGGRARVRVAASPYLLGTEESVLRVATLEQAGARAVWACLPDHRGRGLTTLAEAHTLRALAAAGVTTCATGNDEGNRAMLAVNARLGYRPTASVWSARRAATPGAS